jgi:hypothetical protein
MNSMQIETNPPKHLGNNERVYERSFSKRDFVRAVVVGAYINSDEHKHVFPNGIIGASIGAFLGKILVSLIGHGAICVIAALTGPAAIPVGIALESIFGSAIEGASLAGAIAGGITLGAITGPV